MSGSVKATPLERLARLDTCVVSDALLRVAGGTGGSGYAAHTGGCALGGFLRWGPRRPVVGRALTVELERGPTPPGGSHLGTRALSTAAPDQVIVVANGGRVDAASWGGLLTLEASLRGVAGIVIDGALRDIDEVEALDVPVLARASTPRTARGRYHEISTGEPVAVAGGIVAPGDWVLADGSGVVAVPAGAVDDVLSVAEQLAAREGAMAAELRRGRAGRDVLDRDYETLLDGARLPEPPR